MKLAGPPAMIVVLLLTKRPAPMMPPIEIMVRCRALRVLLKAPSGAVATDSGTAFIGFSRREDARLRAWVWLGRPTTGVRGSRAGDRPGAGCQTRAPAGVHPRWPGSVARAPCNRPCGKHPGCRWL